MDRRSNLWARVAGVSAVAACAVILGGCYERVVRASGPAQGRYTIYEPNLKEPKDKAPVKKEEAPKVAPNKSYGGG